MATVLPDPVSIVETLGLRADAPRAAIKAIAMAADAVGSSDMTAVEKAL